MVSHPQPATMAASFARMLKGQVRCYSAPLDTTIPASKQRFVPTTGTYPQGFMVSGVHVGVKASNTSRPDLALITSVSQTPCTAAAVFTKNKFQAAPVQLCKEMMRGGPGQCRSVVINSGCANAITGKAGLEDAQMMGKVVDGYTCTEHGKPSTLVMSTGVIGQR